MKTKYILVGEDHDIDYKEMVQLVKDVIDNYNKGNVFSFYLNCKNNKAKGNIDFYGVDNENKKEKNIELDIAQASFNIDVTDFNSNMKEHLTFCTFIAELKKDFIGDKIEENNREINKVFMGKRGDLLGLEGSLKNMQEHWKKLNMDMSDKEKIQEWIKKEKKYYSDKIEFFSKKETENLTYKYNKEENETRTKEIIAPYKLGLSQISRIGRQLTIYLKKQSLILLRKKIQLIKII